MNYQRYLMWVAVNGDNRYMSWTEIKDLTPIEQNDIPILSHIYGKHMRHWQELKDAEENQKRAIKDSQRKTRR